MSDRRKEVDRRGGHQAKFPSDDRKERRNSERRTKERIPVKMWIRNIDGNANYYQQTGNLSASGMYILSPTPYPKDTEIQVEFQIPETEDIVNCRALVVNVTDEEHFCGISVKFIDLSAQNKKTIEKAVESLLSDYWYLME